MLSVRSSVKREPGLPPKPKRQATYKPAVIGAPSSSARGSLDEMPIPPPPPPPPTEEIEAPGWVRVVNQKREHEARIAISLFSVVQLVRGRLR